jgi:hypothetical protein
MIETSSVAIAIAGEWSNMKFIGLLIDNPIVSFVFIYLVSAAILWGARMLGVVPGPEGQGAESANVPTLGDRLDVAREVR